MARKSLVEKIAGVTIRHMLSRSGCMVTAFLSIGVSTIAISLLACGNQPSERAMAEESFDVYECMSQCRSVEEKMRNVIDLLSESDKIEIEKRRLLKKLIDMNANSINQIFKLVIMMHPLMAEKLKEHIKNMPK